MIEKQEALRYHRHPTPGKVAIVPTKPCETALDLAYAYSPGVAQPCLAIGENPEDVYNYTSKGNLVAVVSNGTAILGLGNLGPAAAKPVMEGKGILFKMFADIDVFDLELDCSDPERLVDIVTALAPTFGGINLEDIKAPECFYIERAIQERVNIPIFHDDQHGTAIIASAALLNALEITKREMKNIRLVVSGAGAAAISCCRLLLQLGLPRENIVMCDSTGVVYHGRDEGMNEFKLEFATKLPLRSLADALRGADVFFGLSAKDLVSPEMLLSMAPEPIVFAMANPDPEIDYPLAKKTRADVIMATGRSDFPNQVNNVLGFPFIFRGALDVRAKGINEQMKLAAVHALADLAKAPITDGVRKAYGGYEFTFGPEYLIPKPFDPRVLYHVAPAVARAAMDSGMARQNINYDEYVLRLRAKQNHGRQILRGYYEIARKASQKRIAFPEGSNGVVLRAAAMALEEGICEPVLVGRRKSIEQQARALEVDIGGMSIVEPVDDPRREEYAQLYFQKLGRKGVTYREAYRQIRNEHVFSCMLLDRGAVEGVICGVEQNYPAMVRPILRIVGLHETAKTAFGLYLLSVKNNLYFLADTTMNADMTKEKLADIAVMTAQFARSMNVRPRVAMLSFSNFGASDHPSAEMVRAAKDLAKLRDPDLQIDGEMQADTAVVEDILRDAYPFCELERAANVLIFPDMQSGNIAYKLLQRLGGARVVGPIILGLKAPAFVLQSHASVDEVFNMITVAVGHAQYLSMYRA